MKLHIHSVRRPAREVWLQLARSCKSATFFQTPYWHELAQAGGTHYRDATIQLTFSDNVLAVCPLVAVRQRLGGLLHRTMSTFGCCYGGTIAATGLSNDHQVLIQAFLMRRRSVLTLVGNPFLQNQSWHPDLHLRRLTTQVLELNGGFEQILRKFTKGHKAAYTKARREGIRIRRATAARDVLAYYALYRQALARWGGRASSNYPEQLFSAILGLSVQDPELAAIWLAERDGKVLAGATVFYWNGHADYWHGVSDEAQHSSGATNFLIGEAIRDACERRLEWFDFNPSGANDSVASFKRRFGAEELEFVRGDHTHRGLQLLDRVRRRAVQWGA